jgi:hypothetical protein
LNDKGNLKERKGKKINMKSVEIEMIFKLFSLSESEMKEKYVDIKLQKYRKRVPRFLLFLNLYWHW